MTDPILAAAKTALRLEARARRRALMIEHPEADWLAADQAPQMLAALGLRRDGVVAIYKALGAEIDPRPLGEVLRKLGWWTALPAVEAQDAPLVFRRWSPGEPLGKDLTDLAAPLPSAPEVRPDLVIVPLLAFDRAGGRLGQGGGFYDRTLDVLRSSGIAPPFVGLAYVGQEIEHVPSGPHDQRLDGILTEAGYIAARKDY